MLWWTISIAGGIIGGATVAIGNIISKAKAKAMTYDLHMNPDTPETKEVYAALGALFRVPASEIRGYMIIVEQVSGDHARHGILSNLASETMAAEFLQFAVKAFMAQLRPMMIVLPPDAMPME